MGGRRIVLLIASVLAGTAASANAQPALYTGLLTAHVGVASGGNVQDGGMTFGGSMGVLESGGVGAEIDLGYTGEYDDRRLAESNITSFMVNFLAAPSQGRVRPFVVAGLGVLRVGTALAVSQSDTAHTDWAFNAGGGVTYMLNDMFGIRGDVRYLRLFERHEDIPFVNNGYFDYWRTSIGLTWTWVMK